MWDQIKKFFENAWKYIVAVWDKHDEQLLEMVQAILPMIIDVTFRNDLTGEQKRKVILDAIVDNAEVAADQISHAMLNEAIEVAANRYNIQIGKTTVERMDAARDAALKAGRDYTNGQLKLSGTEAEDAGVEPVVDLTPVEPVVEPIPDPEPAPEA